mmetsp:Transcript_25076/g.35850  ORF Transcript_25076/g.35850 Transcript_25076/m.35850 type:complete len:87 (+) Transcript_25076:1741-2001(+)
MSGSVFVEIANAGMLIGTWISEKTVKLIMVGMALMTALHDIFQTCISVNMSSRDQLKADPVDLIGGKKYPASSAASMSTRKTCKKK